MSGFDAASAAVECIVDAAHCHHYTSSIARTMLTNVLVEVARYGSGCVLGHVVGQWSVYSTNATINEILWPALLVDFASALVLDVAFHYLLIAPTSGECEFKTVWRAAKEDVLSLTSFEVGAFALLSSSR